MELGYVFACGIVWRHTADREAGWELIRALRDDDADVRDLAAVILADRCRNSVALLNAAVAAGALSGRDAAEVMAAKTVNHGAEEPRSKPAEQRLDCMQS